MGSRKEAEAGFMNYRASPTAGLHNSKRHEFLRIDRTPFQRFRPSVHLISTAVYTCRT